MQQFDDKLQSSKIAELHHREEEMLIRSLAPKQGYQYIDLVDIPIQVDALKLVPETTSRSAEIAVFKRGNKTLSVAVRNPQNPTSQAVLTDLEKRGFELILFMASLHSLTHAWERYRDEKSTVAEAKGVLDVNPDEIARLAKEINNHLDVANNILLIRSENGAQRISKTIEVLFGGALALNASDIHIEPETIGVRVRYRLDGVLWDISDMEKKVYPLVTSRLKLLSGLKLNVHNEAQDGRFTLDVGARKLEVRASVIPGTYGESIVMRLLDPDTSSFKLENLGLNARLYEVIEQELTRPNGTFLTTGPTGSGKTTALYACMQRMHTPEVKIVTIEDPIEYKLPGIVQTQVDGDTYTFASGLRSILRQDPDIIMVGEIRDRDVAETTINAALTGHYVFSTLHTNSAVGAFPRLIDLGVDPRTIGSAINIVLGQRLVRRLCEHCRVERDATTEEQKTIARIMPQSVAMHTVYESRGCGACSQSGFKGRIGIFEAVVVDAAVEEAILNGLREREILKAAAPQNIPSMQEDGIMKVLAGITSLDELARVVDLFNKNTELDSRPENKPNDV